MSFFIPVYNEAEVLRRPTALASTLSCAVEWVVVTDCRVDVAAPFEPPCAVVPARGAALVGWGLTPQ